jgi:hypothetical protein
LPEHKNGQIIKRNKINLQGKKNEEYNKESAVGKSDKDAGTG